MKDHNCQYPYCIRTALTVTCKKCGKWFCKGHFATPPSGGLGHDCDKVDAWVTAGPSLNAVRGLKPEDVKLKDGMPKLHVDLIEDKELEWDVVDGQVKTQQKPTRKDWKDIIPK